MTCPGSQRFLKGFLSPSCTFYQTCLTPILWQYRLHRKIDNDKKVRPGCLVSLFGLQPRLLYRVNVKQVKRAFKVARFAEIWPVVRWSSAVVVHLCQNSKHLIIQSFEILLLGKYPVRKGEDRDVVLFITVSHLRNITTVAQLTLKTSATEKYYQVRQTGSPVTLSICKLCYI